MRSTSQHSLVTCGTAARALNRIGLPPEPESAYRHINVHNPRCPLFFSFEEGAWACPVELERHPVWGINWAGAGLICRHMGGRLPSRHEWECFASNNDPTRTYPWGDAEPTRLLANFGEHFGGTSTVCSFPASELGLYDLAGNLGEWCRDHFEMAADRRASCERVVKGGAWSKDAHHLEIAASRGKWERLGTTTIGFRPVWDD
jgi:formylglycine-generating enzyme required for sulfatase activity